LKVIVFRILQVLYDFIIVLRIIFSFHNFILFRRDFVDFPNISFPLPFAWFSFLLFKKKTKGQGKRKTKCWGKSCPRPPGLLGWPWLTCAGRRLINAHAWFFLSICLLPTTGYGQPKDAQRGLTSDYKRFPLPSSLEIVCRW
jgi:hypothetical protein